MRLLLMGPPGAGKGTQAEVMTKKMAIPHISTGDMFRKAIKEGTELGRKAKEFMEAGKLVPDEVTIGIVRERLGETDCLQGFLLDGFPRTVPQAQALDGILAAMNTRLDAAINIEVPREKLVERLTGRQVCRQCGATYHTVNNPSRKPNVCDQCSGELYQRSDDTIEAVKSRLDVYDAQTAPLISCYQQQGLLKQVMGEQPIEQVLLSIGKMIGRDWA